MFSTRDLPADVSAVRDAHAPGSPVIDVDAEFETLPPAAAEDLGLFVDSLAPASSPATWLPETVPDPLRRYVGNAFTVGLPGAGTVVRTTQTTPQALLCKRRAEQTPDDFLAFLIADRLVQVGVEPATEALGAPTATGERLPETFVPFFGPLYTDLDEAIRGHTSAAGDVPPRFGPADVFQIAAALFEAWVGLHTRPTFTSWEEDHPRLFAAWVDAGDRLAGRLSALSGEVAHGETDFASATEYACSAVRHGLELPAPFAALDTTAYRDRGAPYAVKWAEKTVAAMRDT